MHVDIKRSDGRVHSAMVTEIKRELNSVNVEWFEKVKFLGGKTAKSILQTQQFFLKRHWDFRYGLSLSGFFLFIKLLLQGETKGKEIDFAALLRTNPTLAAIESPLKPLDDNIKKEPQQSRRITTFQPSQSQNVAPVQKSNGTSSTSIYNR